MTTDQFNRQCNRCTDVSGFYLGTTCPECNRPFRSVKAKPMRSKIIDEMLEEMDKWPWHKKLMSDIRLKIWVWTCLSRKYWDKTYSGYIFRNKK